jgi:hypothetical protein
MDRGDAEDTAEKIGNAQFRPITQMKILHAQRLAPIVLFLIRAHPRASAA